MKIRKSYYQEEPNQSDNNSINSDNLDNLNSKNHDASTSKVHYFEGTPEPKNVTEEKQEDINNISSNSSINQEMNAFQQHIKKIQIDLDDEEKYKNANLHSEDQDNLEIPDDIL
ncbi:unnamed protein product [Rhizophagus irregularis]|uniref:Uncharacterized protein n=1 Tax=Rhizophagus irregularis TaxID=588596 RepID=A0A916EHC4_9GLOM|nr:unnamed protein product [Rhizophagus irregularis]CAB4410035.1 unnamed protein product [Rhizophagus irregularis]CAB5103451.1 unnamed protein product [Rhizophagus irregularis]CAB5387494.1 unnamed protein product [Rhizophagus irregularis]CAB5394282.1 unnamed protein product [Rhizophagus irregularis]